jgi:hypothetical protein
MRTKHAVVSCALEIAAEAGKQLAAVRAGSGVSVEDLKRADLLQKEGEANLMMVVSKFDKVKLLLKGRGDEVEESKNDD